MSEENKAVQTADKVPQAKTDNVKAEPIPVVRQLVKGGIGYVLKVIDKENNSYSEKEFKKDDLINAHQDLKTNISEYRKAVALTKKIIKEKEAEDTPELRKFIEMQEKATKLQGLQQAKDQLAKQEKDINTLESQAKEIKRAIPEVERAKK